MAQHFLLSRAAKTLSLAQVLQMKDADAEMAFRRIRWADTNGEPVCPHCGSVDAYDCRRLKGAPRFRCKGCKKDFSITAGTLFASAKLPLRCYLAAIAGRAAAMKVNGAEVDDLLTDAVNKERERCAKLVSLRGTMCRVSAREIRNAGTFTGSSLHLTWPFIRYPKFVAGKWEARARDMEAIAHAFDMVARGIREGWDPDNLDG